MWDSLCILPLPRILNQFSYIKSYDSCLRKVFFITSSIMAGRNWKKLTIVIFAGLSHIHRMYKCMFLLYKPNEWGLELSTIVIIDSRVNISKWTRFHISKRTVKSHTVLARWLWFTLWCSGCQFYGSCIRWTMILTVYNSHRIHDYRFLNFQCKKSTATYSLLLTVLEHLSIDEVPFFMNGVKP